MFEPNFRAASKAHLQHDQAEFLSVCESANLGVQT